jgi:hypothetical protein
MEADGMITKSIDYIVTFRYKDCLPLNYVPQEGDRIKQVQYKALKNVDYDKLYITSTKPWCEGQGWECIAKDQGAHRIV